MNCAVTVISDNRPRQGKAANESRMSYLNWYQQAFTAIKAPETTALMVSYLPDAIFGQTAALVLEVQGIETNEPRKHDSRFWGGVDFSGVEELRATRARFPALTCPEAEAMFEVVKPLFADRATEVQKRHAVALAIQAASLPHDERADAINALLSIAPRPREPILTVCSCSWS